MGNALKFTFSGSIKIIIDKYKGETSKLYFTIKDTGTGIQPKDLGNLFKLFGKVEIGRTELN